MCENNLVAWFLASEENCIEAVAYFNIYIYILTLSDIFYLNFKNEM